MKPRLPLLLLALSGFALANACACAWDSDTLKDELVTKGAVSTYDLLVGQVPHHGDAYYKARIARLQPRIESGETSFLERNDLAVALFRIEEFDRAEHLLMENHKAKPKDYYTLSNLGVLAKKRGRFKVAARWIARALEIKPAGHMGLGDWYLKMLGYRAKIAENPGSKPTHTFLGDDIVTSFKPDFDHDGVNPKTHDAFLADSTQYQRLANLLRNDQTFADGFLAMGDFLARIGDLHLAFVAYSRAIELKHDNISAIKARRRALLQHWEAALDLKFRGNSKRMAYWDEAVTTGRTRIQKGAAWLKKFQAAEAALVKAAGDTVRFEDVERSLATRKVVRHKPNTRL